MWCDSPSALWFYWVNSEFLHHTDQNFNLVGALQSKTKWTTELQPKFKSLEKTLVDMGDNEVHQQNLIETIWWEITTSVFIEGKKRICEEMIGD